MSSLPTEILVAPGLGGPTCSTCRNEASPDIPCQCEVTVSVGTPRSTRRLSGCWATTWWLGSKRPRGEREGSKLVPVGFSSRGDFGQYVLDEDNIKVQALRLLSKVSKALGEELVIRLLQLASFRSAVGSHRGRILYCAALLFSWFVYFNRSATKTEPIILTTHSLSKKKKRGLAFGLYLTVSIRTRSHPSPTNKAFSRQHPKTELIEFQR